MHSEKEHKQRAETKGRQEGQKGRHRQKERQQKEGTFMTPLPRPISSLNVMYKPLHIKAAWLSGTEALASEQQRPVLPHMGELALAHCSVLSGNHTVHFLKSKTTILQVFGGRERHHNLTVWQGEGWS